MNEKPKFTKETAKGCGVIFVIVIIISLVFYWCSSGDGKKTDANLTPAQKDSVAHQEWVKKQFNSWDGSHIKTEELIKQSMNDPDSYKHVETRYKDLGNKGLLVFTKFRGTNKFGGVVTNNAISKVDSTGNIYDFKIVE